MPKRCIVCKHPAHPNAVCGEFCSGAPLFSSYICKCESSVELDAIDEALYIIQQNLPFWERRYLKVLAAALGRKIPVLPSQAGASVKGEKTRSREA